MNGMLFTVIAALFAKFNIVMGMANNERRSIYIWKELASPIFTVDLKELRGKTVRVIADNMLPYVTSSNTSHELSGYLGDIWTIIQTALEFKSNITSMGYDQGVELITSGRADVMLAAVVYKKGLVNIEYSQPYFYNWYHMYIKKPKAVASSSSYLRTLDDELWFASVSLFLALSFCLWLTMRIIYKFTRQDRAVSLASCLLTVCGGFLNQGYDPKITCYSGRFQILMSLLFGVLLYSAMNAVLVAQLAIFDFQLPFKSLDDVAEQRTHSLCVRTNSFVYNDFIDSNGTLLPKWRNIVNGVGCLDINVQENVAKVICKDNVVVLESRVVISAVKQQYKLACELAFHKTKLFIKPNSFMLLKGFKEKNLIRTLMKRLRMYGILKRMEDTWVKNEISNTYDQVETSPVTIHHVLGILVMLASMILISLFTLSCEILHIYITGSARRIY